MKMQEKNWLWPLLPLLLTLFLGFLAPAFADPLSDWNTYQKFGNHSAKWDSLVEAGFDTFEGGNTETAVNFLKRALSLGCQDGLVFYKLALIVESSGNLKGALEMLEKGSPLLQKNYSKLPATAELPEHLGSIYYQLGRYDEALVKFQEAIKVQGENFLRLYLVGQIYRMEQKSTEAISAFEKSLQYEAPKSPAPNFKQLAQIELIHLYSDAKNFDKVLEIANAILKDDPSNPTAISTRDNIQHQRTKDKERESWKKMFSK